MDGDEPGVEIRPRRSGRVSADFAELLEKYGASPSLLRRIKEVQDRRAVRRAPSDPAAATPAPVTAEPLPSTDRPRTAETGERVGLVLSPVAVTQVLTERQRRIVGFLEDWVNRHGYPPSVREIGDAVGLASPSTVRYHLKRLEALGVLRRTEDRRRGARGPGASRSTAEVPVLGRIAAGVPILAEQEDELAFTLPQDLRGEGDVFVLRVVGESMRDAGISAGDWVVVHRQPTADNGDIVAAMIDGEATVKRYEARDRVVRLHPANPDFVPVEGNDATILGRVIGVLHHL
ncbi:transcriptional repressor LexA [Micromonosporaceae bacterium Da 78-11]